MSDMGSHRQSGDEKDGTQFLLAQNLELREQRAALTAERDELKALHEQTARLVLPGEVDSGDAYLKLLREVRKERDEARAEVDKMREEHAVWEKHSLTELVKERDALRAELEEAKKREAGKDALIMDLQAGAYNVGVMRGGLAKQAVLMDRDRWRKRAERLEKEIKACERERVTTHSNRVSGVLWARLVALADAGETGGEDGTKA